MTTITAEGISTFEADPGPHLVIALEYLGIDIRHWCGGNARCTTCRVEILEGDDGSMTIREQRRLMRATDATPTMRPSCH